MISIDQNCHPLWDVVPKLQALAGRSIPVHHFIEDIDTAFTALGSDVDDTRLRIARERFHRSGGADWGAALFYWQFLGRVPVDIRQWEPMTSMSTHALARKLGRSVDDLYDEFSPSDNWQLIGSSYATSRNYHRTIADLSVKETAPFVREILDRARSDTQRAFPSAESQRRLRKWFDEEDKRVDRMLSECAGASLVEFYRRWLGYHVPGPVTLDLASGLFSLETYPRLAELPEAFLRDYDTAAGLYNESVSQAGAGLRELRTSEGELPFFATMEREGGKVRCGVYVRGDELRLGEDTFALPADRRLPIDALKSAGVRCLAGKAVLLVIQVRLGPSGQPLALPFRGSLYVPAAHLLAEKLRESGLIGGELQPLMRVRFRLLDHMRRIETPIRLPEHLAECFGREEIPASTLGENWKALSAESAGRLESFKNPSARERWQRENLPREFAELSALDARRRELARRDPKSPEIRRASQAAKEIQTRIVDTTIRRIDRDTQISRIDTWDSRGAIYPWCIALGGQTFYNEVLTSAELYAETPDVS